MSNFQPQTYSTDDLRRIISNAGEDDYIDAKAPMSWDGGCEAARLAKDIAAFANSRDGGFIVIGKVEQQPGSFTIAGLTDEQASSFETTKVANWVNGRFAPSIRLTCYRVDHTGVELVVIRVNEFSDIPAICTKGFDDPSNPKKPLLEQGRIYVRTPNAESKPLQKEGELRELIGIATKKQGDLLLQHVSAMLQGTALATAAITDQERADNELTIIQRDLTERGSIDADNGWTFSFHPATYQQERWADLQTLEEHIRRRAVRLSDTFPASQRGTFRTEWGIANDTYGETWALSRSGTFLYHIKFREDSEDTLNRIREQVRRTARQVNEWKYRQFVESLGEFRWTEFKWNLEIIIQCFAFLSRFVDLFEPGEAISYRLNATPMTNRHLMTFDNNLSFEPEFRDPCGSPRFSYTKVRLLEEVLADWRDECAHVLYRFFELFPDYNITVETLRKWVERYVGTTQ